MTITLRLNDHALSWHS